MKTSIATKISFGKGGAPVTPLPKSHCVVFIKKFHKYLSY